MSRSRSKSKVYKLALAKAEAEANGYEGLIGQINRFSKDYENSPKRQAFDTSPKKQRYQYSHGRAANLYATENYDRSTDVYTQ